MAWYDSTPDWQKTGSILEPAYAGMQAGVALGEAALKAKMAKSSLAEQSIRIANQSLALDAKQNEMAAWQRDAPKLAAWQSQPVESLLTSAPPAMESQKGQSAALSASRSVNQMGTAKAMIQTKNEYDKQVATLAKTDPDIASSLFMTANQFPRKTNWDALGIANETARVRGENTRTQAEIDAARRGDTQTTTVGPKGVTDTFKPPAASKEGDPDAQPNTKKLDDGTTLVWMPGEKTLHVIKSPTKGTTDMTPNEMRNYAKDLEAKDKDDPTAKQIHTFLDANVQKQTAAPAATPAPAPSASQYKTQDDVVSAYKSGKLSRDEAKRLLTTQFGVKE